MYFYELPTTGAISFSDLCADLTPNKKYVQHLQHATQARANIRGLLKESKSVSQADKDNLQLVKVCVAVVDANVLHSMPFIVAHRRVSPAIAWAYGLCGSQRDWFIG
jgi:hypothetical protein